MKDTNLYAKHRVINADTEMIQNAEGTFSRMEKRRWGGGLWRKERWSFNQEKRESPDLRELCLKSP